MHGRRIAAVSVLASVAVLGMPAAPARGTSRCDAPPGFEQGGRLEAGDLVLVFRTMPAPIPLGQLFKLEAVVCSTIPGPAIDRLRVDAHMPEHRHGMNYRPSVTAQGHGRFAAEGLLFHMPGRWELVFHAERGGRTSRFATSVVLE